MKYLKLQNDIIKAKDAALTKDKRSPFSYGIFDKWNGEKFIGVIINGNYVILIPIDKFYLNIDYVFENDKPFDFKKFIDDDALDFCKPAEDTGLIKTVADNKRVKILETETDIIWISVDNLKYFDEDVIEYMGTYKKSPVYVCEDGILAGMILPVNHN